MLSNLVRELALNPNIQGKLRNEVDDIAKANSGRLTVDNTAGMNYLKAVINETLRLWNPLPSGTQAITGNKGITIADTYIPGYTTVRVHHLSLMTGR